MSAHLDQAFYEARLKEALIALQKMRTKLEAAERSRAEPIAIIGLGCQFPGGANDPESFWELLQNGVDAISEVPADRWDIEAYYDPDPDALGKISTRWGGFLTGVDQFDASFFGISPREARSLDPQQRLVLEVCWQALEHAGLAPAELAGSPAGVFIGITTNDYLQLQTRFNSQTEIDAYRITGNSLNSTAGRLSYTLGLQGPAMVVDTACSSSLVAVHLACQSLRSGESKLAFAGGVNVILTPDMSISASRAKMMAADGRCKTFDARADGFVRSEGCGMVVLKRLSDALADNDNILALIRGTAVNQDGFSSGLTVPNKLAQEAVVRAALANAGVKPAQVSYIEAHGTGTSLGDPIEVRALAAVLGEGRTQDSPFFLGSVKTNIGHLEAAAGIAGLIKVVLALQHQEIPPHLHFQIPSPNIAWHELPAVVPTQRTPWPGEERFAGTSSFGASGTNAHAILSAAPSPHATPSPVDRPFHLLTLSAKNEKALIELVAKFEQHLAQHVDAALADICFTANTGRAHFENRLAVVAASAEQAGSRLAAFLAGQVPVGLVTNPLPPADRPRLAFLFTGHGSQYINMGRELYETAPVFRQALEQCDLLLRPYLEYPLLSVLFPEADREHFWDGMKYTQPMLFALEYALATLWRAWGIEPDIVLGHSVGEYAAACIAGAMSLEDGLKLVATRGRLMEELPESGAMAAVFADEARVAAVIAPYTGQVAIAVINSPTNIVISGVRQTVEAVLAELQAEGVKSRRLAVAQASHSPLIEPILDEFERTARQVQFYPPRLPLVSNVTGQLFEPGEIPDAHYWRRHLRQTVQFAAGISLLHDRGYKVFLEMGPAPTLLGIGQRCLPEETSSVWLPSLRQGRSDWQQMLESLGNLYVHGAGVNWRGFEQGYTRRRVVLPTYPFQRKRYWLDTEAGSSGVQPLNAGSHPLLGYRLRSAGKEIIFETRLSIDTHPFLADHRIRGTVVLPATAYIEMAQAAAQTTLGTVPFNLEDMIVHKPLFLPEGKARILQLVLVQQEDSAASFQIASLEEGKSDRATETWSIHATGIVRAALTTELIFSSPSLEELRRRCQELISADKHYEELSSLGLEFGPAFQGVEQIWRRDGEVIGQVSLPQAVNSGAYQIHPALLDAALQLLGTYLLPPGTDGVTFLPLGLDQFRLYSRPDRRLWSYVSIRSQNGSQPQTVVGDVRLFDEGGQLVAEVKGFTLKRTGWQALLSASPGNFNDWLYEVSWQPKPVEPARQNSLGLLSPGQVAESLQPHLIELSAAQKTEVFHELVPHLETLSTAYILNTLHQLGWVWRMGQRGSTHLFAQQLQVIEPHYRLLNRLLEILQEDGLLQKVGEEWEVVQVPNLPDPETQLASLLDHYTAARAELTLIGRLGGQFAAGLRGATDPLELLFPDGSLEAVEQLYQDSPLAYGANRLVQEAITAAVRGIPAERPIRILEIGAGTGGTTAHVLPKLDTGQAEYFFTDVSPWFINHARQKFQNYSFVRYQNLDIERDPESQGFAAHHFDLVLAANVLHAAADLKQALRNIKKLLASEGLVVLLEAARPQRYADIIVGLTEGWWKFDDVELRQTYPLLPADRWQELLAELGFLDVVAVSGEKGLSHQAILLARGPRLEQGPGPVSWPERPGSWLIFADEGGIGQQLAERLRAKGQNPLLVYVAETFAAVGNQQFQVNPAEPADFQRLLSDETLRGPGTSWQGVIYLWALDEPVLYPHKFTAAHLAGVQEKICGSVLHLVQALAAAGDTAIPGLWLITRGAQPAGAPDEVALPGLAQSTVWGLGKVIAQEYPEMNCIRVDLDPVGTTNEVDILLQMIEARDREDQVALRRNKPFVPRLVPHKPGQDVAQEGLQSLHGQPFKLDIASRGILDNLEFRPLSRRSPGPAEVEIEVHAVGLGFRDVLNVLGMIAQDTGPLGAECAGSIVAVGKKVDNFKPGDKVIAMALGSFGSHVTVPADFVVHKPRRLNMTEAATIPSAFLTAYYTLHHLANISTGDRVLIHAASGGVGLAAVQLAQRAGAEIFGTAGTPAKRSLLRSLGVQHVLDSRSLSFADEIMSITRGEGVDIILNSLADDFIPKSLSVLADDGTFLEIGKRGVWDRAQVAQLKPNAAYTVADLVTLAEQEPGLIASMLQELEVAFNEGFFHPLPLRAFSIQRVADAFRYMAQARHIGKIVVTLKPQQRQGPASIIHPDATYLITGGLGGLGLIMARWLVDQGARHLVLTGRNAPSKAAAETLSELEQAGAHINVVQADVSQVEAMAPVFAQIEQSSSPLKGIIHAAGVLDDGVLLQQNWTRFTKVLKAKVDGAWNLHYLARDIPLDFFVLFSSAVSLLGSAGQSNHVTANTFLDVLAHYRFTQGLPALSVGWGPWAEVGAAAQENIKARVLLRGVDPMSPQQGVHVFEQMIHQTLAPINGSHLTQLGVMPVDWPKFLQQSTPTAENIPPFLSEVARHQPAYQARAEVKSKAAAEASELLQRLMKAPPGQRQSMLQNYVQAQSLKVLGLEPGYQLAPRKPLQELGLDSLMAVELRNRLGAGLKLNRALPATLVFSHSTVEALSGYLEEQLFPSTPDQNEPPQKAEPPGQVDQQKVALADLEQLSDEEVEAMLLAQLKNALHKDR